METIRHLWAAMTDGDARPRLGDYALALVLIAVLAIGVLVLLGDHTGKILQTVSTPI